MKPLHRPRLTAFLRDQRTPTEVAAIIRELQALDPVSAAQEADVLLRALQDSDQGDTDRMAAQRAQKQAFRDWKTLREPAGQPMAPEAQLSACDEWAASLFDV